MSNKPLLRKFQDFLRLEKGLSGNSIEAYLNDVAKFEKFFNPPETESEKNLKMASGIDIQTFLQKLNELEIAITSQARVLSGLKAFYGWLLTEKAIENDPTALLEAPKTTRYLPTVLSIDETDKILSGIDLSTPEGTRNRAIIETLYATGLRVSELVGLKISGLFPEVGLIRVTGKGSRERIVPIGEDALHFIKIYIESIRSQLSIVKGNEDFVFLNRRGKALTRSMIFRIVQDAVAAVGIDKQVSPHTFRHTFATLLVEGGADLKAVQDMLGHESITTTEIYTHLNAEYLREELLRFHPRNRGRR